MDKAMGVLTKHGYDATHLMGRYQGQKYAKDGLKLDSCSDMFVYCEEVRCGMVMPGDSRHRSRGRRLTLTMPTRPGGG